MSRRAGTAVRLAKWLERGSPVAIGVPASGSQPGVPILVDQFGDEVYLVVEIAWGATPFTSMAGWNWVEVTRDVLYGNAVNITVGAQDEVTQPPPAECTFTLDNRSGFYSLGGQSPNYPNVRQGVPIRVRVIHTGTSWTRFLGYATGFTPAWDSTGRYAVVDVVANGIKRRLSQNSKPLASPMSRYIPHASPAPIAYWPLEDGKNAVAGTPVVGTSSMDVLSNTAGGQTPTITWAANTDFAGASQAPAFSGGQYLQASPSNAHTSTPWTVMWEQKITYSNISAQPGTVSIDFGFAAINVVTYGDGSIIVSGPMPIGPVLTAPAPVGIAWHFYALSYNNVSGNVTLVVDGTQYTGGAGTFTGSTSVRQVSFESDTNTTDQFNVSQVSIYSATYANCDQNVIRASGGWTGDLSGDRVARLCAEQGEAASYIPGTYHQVMGQQKLDNFLNLIQACADVEMGLVLDGFDQGLTFLGRDEKVNWNASMILDASIGQIEQPVNPVHDDYLVINEYTATRNDGTTTTYEDVTGTYGSSSIGTYEASIQTAFYDDDRPTSISNMRNYQLTDYASWKVHQGTDVDNPYRYPTVIMAMHHHPELLGAWLPQRVWGRFDIVNISDVRTQLNAAAIPLLLEGWSERIDQFTWTATCNMSPYEVWREGVLAQPTGDVGEFVMRLWTDDATVTSGCATGGTSIQVSTTDCLWTTTADDFPFFAKVGGNVVLVTGITGSSSPQTFTLASSSVTYAVTVGSQIVPWFVSTLAMTT